MMFHLFLVTLILFSALFLGYPTLIYLLHRRVPFRGEDCSIFQPPISIIVPTIVGGQLMERKVENLLSLNYPSERVEVIVVDSSDRPFHIPEGVKVIRQEGLGKPAALNQAIGASRNEIIVITDDDAVLEADALTRLTSYFSNPSVGGVVGDLTLGGGGFLNQMNSSFYRLFRNSLRRWESSIDTVSFASGELFAFRKSAVSNMDIDVLSDDLYLLFEIRKKGYRVVASDAKVFEEDVPSLRGQMSHKRRTMIGTLQVFRRNLRVLFNHKYGLFGVLIAPMYLLRILLCPVLLTALEILLVFQFPSLIPVTIVLLLGFALIKRDLATALVYGLLVQAAAIVGMIDFATGNYGVGWKKKGK